MQKGLVSLGVNESVNDCLTTKHVIGVLEFSAVLLLYQTTRVIPDVYIQVPNKKFVENLVKIRLIPA